MVACRLALRRSWHDSFFASRLHSSFRNLNVVIAESADVLKPASFADVLSKTTGTSTLFDGVPLSTLSNNARGRVLEELARREEERLIGSTRPAPRETGTGILRFDWIGQDGMRVEAKAIDELFLCLCFRGSSLVP